MKLNTGFVILICIAIHSSESRAQKNELELAHQKERAFAEMLERIQKLESEIDHLKAVRDMEDRENKQRQEELNDRIGGLLRERANDREDFGRHLQKLHGENQTFVRANEHLKRLLAFERRFDPNQRPDGTIVTAESDNNQGIIIDLGTDDGVYPGLIFDVVAMNRIYRYETSELAFLRSTQQRRTQIIVEKVNGAHSSVAGLVSDTDTSQIKTGAVLFNPMWERSRPHHLVALNFAPVEQTRFAAALKKVGLTVVFPGKTASAADSITEDTLGLVIDGDPTKAAEAVPEFADTFNRAESFGVPVLNTAETMDRFGVSLESIPLLPPPVTKEPPRAEFPPPAATEKFDDSDPFGDGRKRRTDNPFGDDDNR